jgi:regulator of replication initiation timing
MASDVRKAWQGAKAQLAEAFTEAWVKASFKQDLGPKFDGLTDKLGKMEAKAKDIEKELGKLAKLRTEFLSDYEEMRDTLETYGKIVTNKARKEKTKHGDQWDTLERLFRGSYIKAYAAQYHAPVGAVEDQLKECKPKGTGIS